MADPQGGYFNLKHRLVGATVLILVAVILLPRVLTGTHLESVRSNVSTPTPPQIESQVSKRFNPAQPDSETVSTKTRIEIIEQPAISRSDTESGLAESTEARSSGGTDDEILLSSGSSISQSVVRGFIVQIGIFQRPENTRNLVSDLKKDDIHAKTEIVDIDGRQATRILIGPFSTLAEATREGNKAMMRTHSKPIIKEWP